jgi:transposase
MPKPKRPDLKREALKRHGVLNPHPHQVRHALFHEHSFFDPRDLVQVKYEMLRRARVDGVSISRSAAEFGLSRPSFYQAAAAFAQFGLAGLVPRKRGPRGGHKLTQEALDAIVEAKATDPSLKPAALAQLLKQRLGVSLHPRSIERGLARQKKSQ